MTAPRLRYSPLLLAGLFAASALPARNAGLNSVHQPVVSGDRAYVPDCPKPAAPLDGGSGTDANYGCAINSNLAAMVANPADLLHGRTDDTTDVENVVRSIKLWHEAPPTGKLWETTTRISTKGPGQ